jgi:site-specific recombinase XerD
LDGSFIEYWRKRENEFVKSESSTWRVYSDTLKIFLNYVNQRDVKFTEIDIDFVNDLKSYLARQRKKDGITPWSEAYIHKVMKTLRSVYNQAIKDSVYETDKNPFTSRVAQPKNLKKKESLTEEEVISIDKLKLETNSSLWHTRNCFIFGILNGGMRIGDILFLKWENVKGSRIEYMMEKNNKFSSLVMSSKSLQILKLYNSGASSQKSYIFPFLAGTEKETDFKIKNKNKDSQIAYINKQLKEIAILANIEKSISTHVARHTYTNLVVNSGGDRTVLQSILKHGNAKTTENYISEIDTSRVDSTHKNALKNLNN